MNVRTPCALRSAALGLALAAAPAWLHAQAFSTSLYLSAGPTRPQGVSASAGARIEIAGTWGAYARAAIRGVTSNCQTSLPPTCDYPDGGAQEYAVGIVRAVAGDPWQGRLRLGGGLLSWQQKSDPFVDIGAELYRPFSRRIALLLGISAVVAPGVERERHGYDTIVQKKTVGFPNVLLGFTVRPL